MIAQGVRFPPEPRQAVAPGGGTVKAKRTRRTFPVTVTHVAPKTIVKMTAAERRTQIFFPPEQAFSLVRKPLTRYRVWTKDLDGTDTKRESVATKPGALHLADTYRQNDPFVQGAWITPEEASDGAE
jgi:hypothetical protein